METSPATIAVRRPMALAAFLVLVFGLSWLAFLPIIVGAVSPSSTAGTLILPLVGIGSPIIAAFVVCGLFAGRAGVTALLRAGGRWRVRLRWYALAILLPLVAYTVSLLAGRGWTGEVAAPDVSIAAVVSGLLVGTLEEFGWSGFALPALRARFGLLRTGAAMGIVVALWHLPLFLTPGQPQRSFSFVPFLLTLILVRTIFAGLYVGSGGSVLLCVLLHASGNAWTQVLPVRVPHFSGAWLVETAVFTVAAIAVATRVARRRRRSSPADVTALLASVDRPVEGSDHVSP